MTALSAPEVCGEAACVSIDVPVLMVEVPSPDPRHGKSGGDVLL